MSVMEDGLLLLSVIDRSIAEGVKFSDKNGKPLPTTKAVLIELLNGEVQIHDPNNRLSLN